MGRSWLLPLMLSVGLLGCSEVDLSEEGASEAVSAEAPESCYNNEEGCACDPGAEPVDCYEKVGQSGVVLQCSAGVRSCEGGKWSACRATSFFEKNLESFGQAPLTQCDTCHPKCFVARDTADGDLAENGTDLVYDGDRKGITGIPGDATEAEGIGPMYGDPFDLDEGDAKKLKIGPDGALELSETTRGEIAPAIWVANTGEGSIGRINVNTSQATGRFWTGPHGGHNNPSRTSVNTFGDVFVGNRLGMTVSKISNRSEACPDTNGDGRVTTSTNNTRLAWGQDDCVLWNTDLGPATPGWNGKRGGQSNRRIRSVAAQDYRDPVTGEIRSYVWVGETSTSRAFLLDGIDGHIILVTRFTYPYGFALDRKGNLWSSGLWRSRSKAPSMVGRLNTAQCIEGNCPSSEYQCHSGYINKRYSTRNCDWAVKETIGWPAKSYGITVDYKQRVWTAGGDVTRYDPSQQPNRRLTRAYVPRNNAGSCCKTAGIAADGNGWIWAAGHGSNGSMRVWGDDPKGQKRHLPSNTKGWGAAVDANGDVWFIKQWGSNAAKLSPGAAIWDNPYVITGHTIRSSYTYSDMTGEQLRLAGEPRGFYYHVFEGCESGPTTWDNFVWSDTIPANSSITFRVRTADTKAALSAQDWIFLTATPPNGSHEKNLGDVLNAAGVAHRRYVQVEVMLESTSTNLVVQSPKLRGMNADFACNNSKPGVYKRVIDAGTVCDVPREQPVWGKIRWRTETPGDSEIEFQLKFADTREEFADLDPVSIKIPPRGDIDELDVTPFLAQHGIVLSKYLLEMTVLLNPGSDGMGPVYKSANVDFSCEPGN